MLKFVKTGLVGLGLSAMAFAANATPILPGNETPLQEVLNQLYANGGTPIDRAPDVNADQLLHDELWAIEASGGAWATFIVEIAGNASINTFGIYSGNTLIQLFNGAASTADKASFTVSDTGAVNVVFYDDGLVSGFTNYGAGTLAGNLFGFYLWAAEGIFYSESSRNADGADQMVAFRGNGVDQIKLPGAPAGTWGSSSYILAWEDILYGNSDKDFNDLVVYVESVNPVRVPEPATLGLLGLGLVGVGFLRGRRRTSI